MPAPFALEADFTKAFLFNTSMFETADDAAMRAAEEAVHEAKAIASSNPSTRKGQKNVTKDVSKTKPKKDLQKNKPKLAMKKSKKKAGNDGPWWSAVFGEDSCEKALRSHMDFSQDKKLTMSCKNFASRVYHKVDDICCRSVAQEAHASAIAFWHKHVSS